jgi:Cu+-exporting ATPase
MSDKEVVLQVEGMTCSNCAAGISKALKKKGFSDADANFASGEVSFSIEEGLSLEKAIENINSLGYKVLEEERDEKGLSKIEKKFIAAAIFTIPLFLHMFFPHESFINHPLVQISLCLPVYSIGFMHFGKSAWGSLKGGVANMDVLIFVGSSAAFFYSIAGTILFWGQAEVHNFMFYETAATIITLVLLGNVMEHRAVKQTGKQIGLLQKLENPKARIVMMVGTREKIFETEATAVKKGDLVQILTGDGVPVDGKVTSGEAYLDESAITGESEPIYKKPGDALYSGTIVLEGQLRMEAADNAKNSTLQKILSLVKAARKDQPEIQILGDKVSAIFVPAVLGIAALTFILSYFVFNVSLTNTILNSVAVLVISCPCAMGLATPTAVVAGIGRAAKLGVLIKGGSTLENYAKADTIVFDKTGTLTSGNFQIELASGDSNPEYESIIKALEANSNHPIAQSFVEKYRDIDEAELSEVHEVKSEGMYGKTARGEAVFFGKSSSNIDGDLELKINSSVVATYRISDEILPGARETAQYLQSLGKKCLILSGDKFEKVEEVANELGIDEFHAALNPEEKLNFIKELSAKGTVAMVGDGINDGPSLAAADIGVSHGGATTLAMESSKVVLMNPDTMKTLQNSIAISGLTYKTIKQNLFWAFAYNVIAIPIAAFGFLNPMVAALAMAFSDVIVIGNSIRLRYRKVR